MTEERKLIKVTMEYDDRDNVYIEGNDVKKWQEALNSAITLDYIHGGHSQDVLKDITWKKI